MRRSFRVRWQEAMGTNVEEDISAVSADLPYELQSKMFDQLAAVSIGGAGLTVTLIGSLLRGARGPVWIPVVAFGLAAGIAVVGNIKLIEGLFSRQPVFVRSKIYTAATVALIGMALGALSMSVYYDAKGGSSRESPSAARG
jgi:hypothetical protein